ncbi:hypothetical protein MUU72_28310 [Streptomyces sp. RS10V-4]|uniref:hypothetical protein n=1 Tax=Streptomyces rhizoryzae TaxID=2932493 RepID=UPI002005290B|nr:hypothetical protein [Streptomyces rhizoryzae]MCK7626953.1 hypothetical protein [Streptomyces rhizoryzae]
MSDGAPVDPSEVPVFTGDLDLLEAKVKSLSNGGSKVATAGSDVHKSFGGLSAYYKAPEAEQLFGVTKPVADKAREVGHDARVIAGALGTYASEIRPLVKQLQQLKQDAAAFRHKVDSSDDDWREDSDLTDENLARRNKIAEVWAAFQAAERDCHAKIVGLVGGKALHAIDASHKNGYGYDAETLKQSRSLPWGDAVEESVPWWKVWDHAYDFGKGVIIDGAWGGIKGLLTLFGWEGSEAAGQAWLGLAKLTTTTSLILAMPGLAAPYLMTPGRMLPSWFRDSRTAMLETGKAFVAWDQWESNGSRAAGAVTFNAITAIITRGGGAAVEGATKAGVAVRAVSVAGKVGEVIDPMTYVFKGAGTGISKIGDVMAHLKNAGHFQVPKISEGVYSLPEGATKLPDGTIQLPKDAAIPEGANKLSGSRVKLPEGTVELPPNTVKDPATGRYMSGRGDLYNEDGSLFQRAEDAPKGQTTTPTTGADNPRTESPVRQEQPVLVGVGGRSDDVTRVGSDISDPVSAADDVPVGRTDTAPGGTLSHTPAGHAADRMVTNELDNASRGGRGDAPHTDGSHPDSPSTADHSHNPSHSDGPSAGGSHADGPGAGGSHHEPPSAGGIHPGSPEESARGAENAAHRAEYEAAREKPADERTPAERAAITREHVRLANEDPVWRAKHYDKWGLGKRNNGEALVDGQLLPKLAEKPGGGWMAADDLPYANSEKYHLDDLVRGRDTVGHQGHLNHLDDVSAKRVAGMDLKSAEKAYENNPTHETAQALADAQDHFNKTVGEGVSNNTKLGEALGEEAARCHMLLQKEFEGAHEITDLPETPNGSKRFDQLWRDKDGNLIIVEAKGPNARLDWRKGNGALDRGTMVKQGTLEYVRTICADMEQRALVSPKDAQYAKEIRAAIENKTLRYVLVQATENTGSYAGAELKYLKIF